MLLASLVHLFLTACQEVPLDRDTEPILGQWTDVFRHFHAFNHHQVSMEEALRVVVEHSYASRGETVDEAKYARDREALLHDGWGTPIRHDYVERDGVCYVVFRSAGRDRVFGTEHDLTAEQEIPCPEGMGGGGGDAE